MPPLTPSSEGAGWARVVGVILAVILLLAIAAGMGGIVYSLAAGSVPKFQNPNFLDALIESRVVLAFIRFAILAAAVYVVVSVIAHISRGRWLSSVGPAKVSESVQAVTDEADALRDQLRSAESTIQDLRAQLERTQRAVGVAARDRDEVIHELSKLRRSLSEQGGSTLR